MDLGVGSFVFSQGIVSAVPLIRDPAYITAPMFPKLFSVTKHSLPVIVLGVVRILLVKGTEYPEHVTEYGVHWNFFITLALLPILQVCLHPLIRILPVSAVGFLVGVGKLFPCISSHSDVHYWQSNR
jgi:phosphatidylinositol glycan class W